MNKRLSLSIVVLVVFVLVCGCTQQAAPAGPVAAPTVQAITQDPPGPVVTSSPITTPIRATLLTVKEYPDRYVYEKNGEYYFQKPGFVCTDSYVTSVLFWNKSNTLDNGDVDWCER